MSLILVASGLACGAGGKATGRWKVEWIGADTAAVAGPAEASWCAPARMLGVILVTGDRGAALRLRLPDSILPGRFPVGPPASAQDTGRVAASVAVRLVRDQRVRAFVGDSGWIELTDTVGGVLSGRLEAGLSEYPTGERLVLRGRFRHLPVRRAPLPCAPAGDPGPARPAPPLAPAD